MAVAGDTDIPIYTKQENKIKKRTTRHSQCVNKIKKTSRNQLWQLWRWWNKTSKQVKWIGLLFCCCCGLRLPLLLVNEVEQTQNMLILMIFIMFLFYIFINRFTFIFVSVQFILAILRSVPTIPKIITHNPHTYTQSHTCAAHSCTEGILLNERRSMNV